MNLDINFIILSTLLTACLLPFYIYRKKVLSFYFKKQDITSFIKDLKIYLKINIKNIKFTYEILESIKEEKDPRMKQTLIIEDMISQFVNYKYSTSTQTQIAHNLIWSSYENDSLAVKNKAPSDIKRRKELAWKRDGEHCDRCGQKTKLLDSHLSFAKNIEDGGTYHFENLVTLCSDCYRIVNSKVQVRDLHLEEILMKKAQF